MTDHFGQLMLDVEGLELTPEDREIIEHPLVGGIILFKRNYADRAQVKALTSAIKEIKKHCIIAVDQEGGRVQRFVEEFTILPALGTLGESYLRDPKTAIALARSHAHTLVTELKSVGVDISFTPVLDRNIGLSTVIGDRSFASDPENIVAIAQEYIAQMRIDGMPATGKHFPGHGAVVADSHYALPVDERDLDSIMQTDLIPFARLANQLGAVMAAHVCYPKVSELPAGFDRFWLQTLLRDRLSFKGVVFSDDLSMSATLAYGHYSDRAELSFAAGCDMVLVCNNRQGAIDVLESHGHFSHEPSSNRLWQFAHLCRSL